MINFTPLIATIFTLLLTPYLIAEAQVLTTTPTTNLSPIDIIVEGETYVPYFYGGRAEPSAGNNVRLVALMETVGGQALTYRWKVGNTVISTDVPVLQTKMPEIEERVLIEVTALDTNNRPVGKGSEYVTISTPRIVFYEDNALRGTAQVAIGDSIILIGDELAVKAEPYFAGVSAVDLLTSSWSSNLTLEIAKDDWRLVYIKSTEEADTRGEVSLRVSNPQNLNEFLSATFNVNI